MTKCLCGKRQQGKCTEYVEGGKMCLKEPVVAQPNDMTLQEAFDSVFLRYEKALEELAKR